MPGSLLPRPEERAPIPAGCAIIMEFASIGAMIQRKMPDAVRCRAQA
ncbi:hypothetical protein ACWIEX_05685 [Bosea sp. NPDC055353]